MCPVHAVTWHIFIQQAYQALGLTCALELLCCYHCDPSLLCVHVRVAVCGHTAAHAPAVLLIRTSIVIPAINGISAADHPANTCPTLDYTVKATVLNCTAIVVCHDTTNCGVIRHINIAVYDEVFDDRFRTIYRPEQPHIVGVVAADLQAGYNVAIAIKCTLKALAILPEVHADRRPLLLTKIDVCRQHYSLSGKDILVVYLRRQPCQLRAGADLIDSLSVGNNFLRGRAVPLDNGLYERRIVYTLQPVHAFIRQCVVQQFRYSLASLTDRRSAFELLCCYHCDPSLLCVHVRVAVCGHTAAHAPAVLLIRTSIVIPAINGISAADHPANTCPTLDYTVKATVLNCTAIVVCHDTTNCGVIRHINIAVYDEVFDDRFRTIYRPEQPHIVGVVAADLQAGYNVAIAIKCTLKALAILPEVHADRRPLLLTKIDVCRQHYSLSGKDILVVYLRRQPCQLRAGADLIDSLSVGNNFLRGRAVPRIGSSVQRYAQQGILLDIIDGVIICIFFVCNHFVILAGVLILIRLGGLLALAVLVLAVSALGVLAGVSVSWVRVALDDGRAAAIHHLRGKGRGGHQRQREHHAHQQAHDAPGHTACPFLHVICSSRC